MNAFTSLVAAALPSEAFDAATAQFHAWRGKNLDIFSRTEAAVTETLLALRSVGRRGEVVKMPHLVGQRYAALDAAIGPIGPFAAEGKKAIAALTEFDAHTRIRTMLCHGVGDILLDRHGRWTVLLRNLSLSVDQAERDSLLLSQDEADLLQAAIARASQVLCSHLGHLRTNLVSAKS
ncbi:hypothetical protein LQ953_04105 [Sphingomonas sp. IC-56]|uniref:hypothetical protein n=1 Tax=Sphingomonas sp. IC-56 TaxID=2898529 RepID=UPI001E2BE2B7|nr:hypothetical protein [Sphingomonas sp. IC-56]MCD2323199.1 hypothetical protein [Sphingomonas sp. IC-56]